MCLAGVVATILHRDLQQRTLVQVFLLRFVQELHFTLVLRENVYFFPLHEYHKYTSDQRIFAQISNVEAEEECPELRLASVRGNLFGVGVLHFWELAEDLLLDLLCHREQLLVLNERGIVFAHSVQAAADQTTTRKEYRCSVGIAPFSWLAELPEVSKTPLGCPLRSSP